MNHARTAFIAALLVVLCLAAFLLLRDGSRSSSGVELTVHCAAGLQKPVQEIAREYEKEYGVKVRLNYGPSGALSTQIEGGKFGDLYLPADVSYVDAMRKKGLAREAIPVAWLTAGIVVPKGNPENIRSLADLAKGGIKVSLANVEASVGKFTSKVLKKTGHWEGILSGEVVFKPTVNAVVEDVALNTVDAALAWDAVVKQFDGLEFVSVPEFESRKKNSTICVLETSQQPTEALRFARYLAASDRGQKIFQKHHFATVEGDEWSRKPELRLFAGSMLRPAIETIVRAFETREGVSIVTVYEGCGTLVNSMRATGKAGPDAYFSCDVTYLDMVKTLFVEDSMVVASNDMIILVPRENHAGISSITDLARSGVKVGLCDPKKSALGGLTDRLLRKTGLLDSVEKNVETRASKGDELVNQVQVGALDAAIVYRSNARASEEIGEKCRIVELGLATEDAIARQPFAVGQSSRYKQLMVRLRDALTSSDAQGEFERLGFSWEANPSRNTEGR